MSEKKVYQAIAQVTEKLAKEGISKNRNNAQQGYKFRGIDDVYNALAPFLASSKLCILPNVQEREVIERQTKNGGALFYVTVKVDFAFVSAEDGSEHHVITYGEAMDSGDKATNKAMSAAYKYAAMQAFCIPTEGDNDADATTHEVEPKITQLGAAKSVGKSNFEQLPAVRQQALTDLHTEVMDELGRRTANHAYDMYREIMDTLPDEMEQTAFRSLFNSQVRTAFTKIYNQRKEAA